MGAESTPSNSPEPLCSSEVSERGSLCWVSRDLSTCLVKHWSNPLPPSLGQRRGELAHPQLPRVLGCKSPAARSAPLSWVWGIGWERVRVSVDLEHSRYTFLAGTTNAVTLLETEAGPLQGGERAVSWQRRQCRMKVE